MTIAVRWCLALALATAIARPAVAQPAVSQCGQQALEGFQVIAHRGASGHAPEHTRPAQDKAIAMGADFLELDLHMSADGRLIVIHDDSVDRTTNGTGEVGAMPLERLKALDAGSWFNQAHPQRASAQYVGLELLTLDEVFERYGNDVNYYIETKSPQRYPQLQEALLDLLERYDLRDGCSVVVQSFSRESLKQIHALEPRIPLVQLLWYAPGDSGDEFEEWHRLTPPPSRIGDDALQAIGEYAVGIGTNVVGDDGWVIDRSFVRRAHDNGLLVHPYTINDREVMRRLLTWQVDGMFTDYPDRLQTLVE